MSGGAAGRVLWIHQNFVTARQAGNARAIHAVAALLHAGWSVDVVASRESYLGARVGGERPGTLVEAEGALCIHRLGSPGAGQGLSRRARAYLGFNAAAARYLRTLPRPDVVFASSPPSPQLLVSLWAAVRFGAPMVLEVRDLWPAFLLEGGMLRPGPVAEVAWWAEALACRAACGCIAASPVFAPYLRRLHARQVTTAFTGADPALLSAGRAAGTAWRRAAGLEGRIVVAYTGSLNEPYGVDGVLRAVRLLAPADPRVVWVFAGEGRGRPLVQRAAAETDAVRYLGALPRDALIPLLAGADVGLHTHAPWPLLDTTISGKLFDYLAAGLPVVSTSAGLTGEILRAAGAGVVANPGPEGLAAAVGGMAARAQADRRAMGEHGRAWAARHASASAGAARIAEVVAAARHAPPLRRMDALQCAALAARDVLARRPQRAIRELFGGARAETVAHAFGDWLAAAAADAAVPPPPMPRLLSGQGAS